MENSFTPLLPPATRQQRSVSNSRLKVLPAADAEALFKVPAAAPTSAAPSSHQNCADSEPQITLQREGEHITHIQVRCSCGKVIDLNCVY